MRSRATRSARGIGTTTLAVALGLALSVAGAGQANAAPTAIDLGNATGFAVLAGTSVTNTLTSTINGDLGVTPGSAATGFPPGQMITGNIHINDSPATNAMADLGIAYDDADGRTPPTNGVPFTDLAGMTLVGGVYNGSAIGNTGTVTLDGGGDPSSVWIFQASSTLITDSSSVVALTNGANACNVFWQVDSSATLGSNSTMVGTVMALTSISANTGANVEGRLLARNGGVTLQGNNITVPAGCTGTIAAGGSKTTPAVVAPVAGLGAPAAGGGATLPDTGTAVEPAYLFTIVGMICGGVLLMLVSRRTFGGRTAEAVRGKRSRPAAHVRI